MNKINSFLQKYISLNISLLIIIILLRFFELIYASNLHALPEGSFLTSCNGFLFDIYLLFILSGIFLFPYLVLCYINPKIGTIFYKIIGSIVIIIYLSLIHYFVVQLIPLGKDFFAYTSSEIMQTATASGELKLTSFIPFLIFVPLFLYLPKLLKKIIFRTFTSYAFIGISILSLFFMSSMLIPDIKNYKNDLEFYLANNKLNYFIYDNKFKGNKESVTNYDETSTNYDELSANNKQSISTIKDKLSTKKLSDDYPFLHIEDSKDVLGQFFNKSDKKPNIVIILTESLSAAFTGKDAYLGSFTPFLDSLIDRSLYWKNFLSTSGRTFGVTPAVLGSLPFGKNGFLEMGNNAPDHMSLVSLLKDNGYYCSFYYGGDPHFDLMDVFYKNANADFILRQKDFGNGYIKFPSNSGGFSWGYADKEVFRKSFEIMNSAKKEPRLDVYMTLAMHSPFMVPNQEYYNKKFEKRLSELGIARTEKAKEYISDKEKYASILYTDDAFRYFINEYKKRDDFKNTIFIITGDHRMAEIPVVSKIDKFHVPLIIYSPMLKQKEMFESVSSHLDITPTLLAYLKANYGIKVPPTAHWLGNGIDVNKSFRNIHSLAFMWDKNDLINYIDGNYFVNEDQLFKLSRNMNIDPITNDTISARIQSEFNRFKKLNSYVCSKKKLYPDKKPNINGKIVQLLNKMNGVLIDPKSKNLQEKQLIDNSYKKLYFLAVIKVTDKTSSQINFNIFNSKNEKIINEILPIKQKGKDNTVILKKIISIPGSKIDKESYINITFEGNPKEIKEIKYLIYGEN